MSEKALPEIGEIVVCTVSRVLDYGVFVELPEYNNLKGFIHISQVSSGWIKNIRNFVREKQIRAARVISIDRQKGQIDLSFTKVFSHEEKAKIEWWKQDKRNKRFIEMLAKESKQDFEKVWKEVAEPLIEEFETLQGALYEIALRKEEAIKNIPKNWHKPLLALVEKNVPLQEKAISGTITLVSTAPNGVEVIKSVLGKAQSPSKEVKADVSYLGAGRYLLKVSSYDFKESERALQTFSQNVLEEAKEKKAIAKFEKSA